MSTTQTSPSSTGVAKKRVFNLDTFEKETKEVSYPIPAPLTSVDEVLNLEPAFLLKVANAGLAREAWKTARASIAGASPKVVNQMVNVFRMLPPYSDLVKNTEDSEGRKKQTQAIYAFIRSNESILNSLKEAAARQVDDEDEEGEGDGE